MKILIAPDSFKGSLTAQEAARAMAAGVGRALGQADIRLYPLADGGEGTLEAVLSACGGERRNGGVTGAEGRPVLAAYGVTRIHGEAAAVMEVAQVVGLPMLGSPALPVEQRTSRGVGELIGLALAEGARHCYIGLGGSSTNDGGAGLLQALGVRFLDPEGNVLGPAPEAWARHLARLDFTGLDARLASCRLTLLSDVQNPLCGARGATAVFGPQKGVAAGQVKALDAALARLGALGDAWAERNVSGLPGAGAAGGLGWALQLLGAQYRSGAETICDLTGFDQALDGATWVLTGEGRSDAQTLEGKAPAVVAGKARAAGVPVSLLSGAVAREDLPRLGGTFNGCFAASFGPGGLNEALAEASARLDTAAEQLARLFATGACGGR